MKKVDKEKKPSLAMRKSVQQTYWKVTHKPDHEMGELPSVGQFCLVSISRSPSPMIFCLVTIYSLVNPGRL